MTVESVIGLVLTSIVSVIAFLLKTLVTEHKSTRDTVISLTESLKNTSEDLIQLKRSEEALQSKVVEIIERLVRLEERTSTPVPQKKVYKRVKSGQ